MKNRFTTFDVICGVTELQQLVGLRVNQIYDVDNKTYLIKLQNKEKKSILLLESGIRFHATSFEWPKHDAPSGFSMKLRKHLKNKRLEKVEQLGSDRIVNFEFGSGEAKYHLILELYDKGNIVLTDYELNIVNVLRQHSYDNEDSLAVRKKYPVMRAKSTTNVLTKEALESLVLSAEPGSSLKQILVPVLGCGPSVINHVLLKHDLNNSAVPPRTNIDEKETIKTQANKKKKVGLMNKLLDINVDFPKIEEALLEAESLVSAGRTNVSKGYIIQKHHQINANIENKKDGFLQNIGFQPFLFHQNKNDTYKEFDSFLLAVDEFFSNMESDKIDLKAAQQEQEALKKLSNVKNDHCKRLDQLNKLQTEDEQKAEFITRNQKLVDNAIIFVRNIIANQMAWSDINDVIKVAQENGDPVATLIKQLKLGTNHITLSLKDPYDNDSELVNNSANENVSVCVDVDLSLSAFGNARKYYYQKKNAGKKEQRTIAASEKALKSAEKRTQQALKDVQTISKISKARKVYWFEKFYWFISSENYLVIAGRDALQNELLVKRYMRSADVYVHADVHGAASVIIKNPTEDEIPPKTLLEAGTMAISYSVAWEAKIIPNVYWVKSNQVSKTAPTGEYLPSGSFMIRGKKNFLPLYHFAMGITLLFKLEESSIERHKGERKVKFCEENFSETSKLELVSTDTLENDVNEALDTKQTTEPSEISTSDHKEDLLLTENTKTDLAVSFPNMHIQISHNSGTATKTPTIDEHERIIRNHASSSQKKTETDTGKQKETKTDLNTTKKQNASQLKRGQKGKLKKMKAKYKDQDEEERELRMGILKSAGKKNEDIQDLKEKSKVTFKSNLNSKQQEYVETNDVQVNTDVDMLDSLTGSPVGGDELLYAIPVVAPYQAIQNYKFKLKLTPGNEKRGKAAKTAIAVFSKSKGCTLREKDLMKGIKEDMLSRNIPGKVKLSLSQLHTLKK